MSSKPARRQRHRPKALRTLHAPARTNDAEARRRVIPPPARPRLRSPRFVRYPPGRYSALSISSGPDRLRSSVPVGETQARLPSKGGSFMEKRGLDRALHRRDVLKLGFAGLFASQLFLLGELARVPERLSLATAPRLPDIQF